MRAHAEDRESDGSDDERRRRERRALLDQMTREAEEMALVTTLRQTAGRRWGKPATPESDGVRAGDRVAATRAPLVTAARRGERRSRLRRAAREGRRSPRHQDHLRRRARAAHPAPPIEAQGDLWVAIYGGSQVRRYGPDGALRQALAVPAQQTTSCAFAGPGLTQLYVTTATEGWTDEQRQADPAAGLVYRIETDTTGLPATPFCPRPSMVGRGPQPDVRALNRGLEPNARLEPVS